MDRLQLNEEEVGVRRPGNLARLLLVGLLASAIDIGAFYWLGRMPPADPARIAVALMPLPGNVTLLVMILRRIRRLDEFQKRVQFEAVVVGFLATGVAVFVYAYLQKAQAVGPLNMGLVWAFMIAFYGVGYFVAVSHYR